MLWRVSLALGLASAALLSSAALQPSDGNSALTKENPPCQAIAQSPPAANAPAATSARGANTARAPQAPAGGPNVKSREALPAPSTGSPINAGQSVAAPASGTRFDIRPAAACMNSTPASGLLPHRTRWARMS
jgi:hypothetical protein